MTLNIKKLREKLNQRLLLNQELLTELHLTNSNDLSTISDAQLEERITPKLLGLISMRKHDLRL